MGPPLANARMDGVEGKTWETTPPTIKAMMEWGEVVGINDFPPSHMRRMAGGSKYIQGKRKRSKGWRKTSFNSPCLSLSPPHEQCVMMKWHHKGNPKGGKKMPQKNAPNGFHMGYKTPPIVQNKRGKRPRIMTPLLGLKSEKQ